MLGAPTGAKSSNKGRYGEPWLAITAPLRLDGGLGQPNRLVRLTVAVIRRPRLLWALIALLVETPREVVPVSGSAAGRALETYFSERFLGLIPQNRLCRGVLVLPNDHAQYLRGRHRQALRTNLRRAALAGVRCEECHDPAIALVAVQEVLAARRTQPGDLSKLTQAWERIFSRPETTVLVGRDRDGRAVGLIAAVVDDRVGLIRIAVACHHGARWALHDHLVRMLITRRVRYLLAEGEGPFGALGFPPEIHHYQRLLGYELRHVVPRAYSSVCPR